MQTCKNTTIRPQEDDTYCQCEVTRMNHASYPIPCKLIIISILLKFESHKFGMPLGKALEQWNYQLLHFKSRGALLCGTKLQFVRELMEFSRPKTT
jgi:hypothetical protein